MSTLHYEPSIDSESAEPELNQISLNDSDKPAAHALSIQEQYYVMMLEQKKENNYVQEYYKMKLAKEKEKDAWLHYILQSKEFRVQLVAAVILLVVGISALSLSTTAEAQLANVEVKFEVFLSLRFFSLEFFFNLWLVFYSFFRGRFK